MKQKIKVPVKILLECGPKIYFLILSVFTFFLVEVLSDSGVFFRVETLRIFFMLLNVGVYYILYWFLYSITNSVVTCSILGLSVFNIIGMINYFVCVFRGSALKFSDIFSAKTAADVASMYKFEVGTAHIIWLILLLFTIAYVICHAKYSKDKYEKMSIKTRAISTGAYLIVILVLLLFDFSVMGINAFDGWSVGGYALYFMDSVSYYQVKEPDNYDGKKYAKISEITELNNMQNELPNIVVIMNESFCDIERIMDVDTNKEIMPFFQQFVKGDNIVEGDLYVSAYAGSTANTEMEFLTASSAGFWGVENICYTMGYSNDLDILPNWLGQIGYTTYAGHPARGNNYSRKIIYDKMKFQNKLFIEDFMNRGAESVQYPDASYFLKDIINDSENYKVVSDIVGEEQNPVFIFNTTIQNHGGYEWRGLNDINIQNKIADKEIESEVNEYLSLIKQSDSALEDFVAEVETWEEDTIILFFGDHQPNVTIDLHEELSLDLRRKDFFKVPFFIWANYEIETQHDVQTSVNYLQNMLLETAGVGLLNEYQKNIAAIQEEYPILSPVYTIDKDGNEISFDELLKKNEKIKEYYHQSYKVIYDANE